MQNVVYHFRLDGGRIDSIRATPDVEVDAATLPPWTLLEFQRCANCPLPAAPEARCPMALQFVKLTASSELRSYQEVTVVVETPERRISKKTTVQRAVGSLMGLLAAGSACPRTAFLAPMAHFHLPFATEEETIYRVASMYLLSQYFIARGGGQPDWELAGLKEHYRQLQTVNAAMAARLRAVGREDGAINALILLDLLAKALPYSIDDALDDVRQLFPRA